MIELVLWPPLFYVILAVVVSMAILTRVVLYMVDSRETGKFMPFFIWGVAIGLVSGFMFYGFFGKALDMFLAINLVAVFGFFFVLRRGSR